MARSDWVGFGYRVPRYPIGNSKKTMADEPEKEKKQAALDEGDIKLLKAYVRARVRIAV